MSETGMRGELRIQGHIHGKAVNCLEVYYEHPDEWVFRQFVTDEQMSLYAEVNSLTIIRNSDENNTGE